MRSNVPEIFGSMVFNDAIMRDKLPKDIYKSLKKTIEDGKDLDITVANVVAIAMKDCYPLYTLVPADDRDHR